MMHSKRVGISSGDGFEISEGSERRFAQGWRQKNDTDNAGDKARLDEVDQEACGHNEQFHGARKRSPRTGVAL